MLTHDLLVMLHVRVRIYITRDVKVSALKRMRKEKEGLDAMKVRRAAKRAGALLRDAEDKDRTDALNDSDTRVSRSRGPSSSPTVSAHQQLRPGRSYSRSKSPYKTSPIEGERDTAQSAASSRAPHQRHRPAVSFDSNISVAMSVQHSEPASNQDSDEYTPEDPNDHTVLPTIVKPIDESSPNGHDFKQSSTDFETSELEEEEDADLTPSFLADPERATRGPRRWLDEICRAEGEDMVKGFRRFVLKRSMGACITKNLLSIAGLYS